MYPCVKDSSEHPLQADKADSLTRSKADGHAQKNKINKNDYIDLNNNLKTKDASKTLKSPYLCATNQIQFNET